MRPELDVNIKKKISMIVHAKQVNTGLHPGSFPQHRLVFSIVSTQHTSMD
jgi:hypothetical protein